MATQSIPAAPLSQTAKGLDPLWRLAGLAGLFTAEVLLISARTPHDALRNAPGLPGLVFSLGLWKVRVLVTLAILCLLCWHSRRQRILEQSSRMPVTGFGFIWLAAHLAAILSFSFLTWILFANTLTGARADGIVVGWVATGVASVIFAAFAFLPRTFWKEMLQGTGDAWAYVVVLGAGACVFAAYSTPIWNPLARWTLKLSGLLLRPFVPGLIADPARMMLGTRTFSVEVAPACSGYEGIGLILAFTAGWLWFLRREWRFPHALLLIPLGVAAIWIFNALRVAALILIGLGVSPAMAMQGFHSHAGWIAFNAVALGTCMIARRTAWFTTAGSVATVPSAQSLLNPAAPYLMPFLAILAAGMLAGAASSGFEWFYALRVVAAGAALWYFRDRYRALDWSVSWQALALGGLVFLMWIGLERWTGGVPMSEPWQLASASMLPRLAWIAVRVVGAVVTVPIAEELAFRGFLLRRIASADFESVGWRAFAWAPFLISSVAFGLLHGDRWLAGIVAGMVYAVAMLRKGRIGEAVVAHAVTNGLLAIYVLISANWQLW